MAEVTRKRQGEMLRGVFSALLDYPDGRPAGETIKAAELHCAPTPYEESPFPGSPNVRRFEKLVRFSTINAVKAGWLVKEKGTWHLTEAGRAAFEKFTDPEELGREAVRLYLAWKKGQPDPSPVEEQADDAETVGTIEEAEETAWTQIREYLAAMPPYDFQNLVAALLKAMGYHVLWVAPPGPDRGIDIVAHNDPLGTTTPRILVQVKRQTETKVPVEGLRAFMAVLGDRDVGIFISSGGFTSDAEREARSQEKRRLTLLDLNRLVELWIEHFSRLDETDRQRLPLKPVYFLAPRS